MELMVEITCLCRCSCWQTGAVWGPPRSVTTRSEHDRGIWMLEFISLCVHQHRGCFYRWRNGFLHATRMSFLVTFRNHSVVCSARVLKMRSKQGRAQGFFESYWSKGVRRRACICADVARAFSREHLTFAKSQIEITEISQPSLRWVDLCKQTWSFLFSFPLDIRVIGRKKFSV